MGEANGVKLCFDENGFKFHSVLVKRRLKCHAVSHEIFLERIVQNLKTVQNNVIHASGKISEMLIYGRFCVHFTA